MAPSTDLIVVKHLFIYFPIRFFDLSYSADGKQNLNEIVSEHVSLSRSSHRLYRNKHKMATSEKAVSLVPVGNVWVFWKFTPMYISSFNAT